MRALLNFAESLTRQVSKDYRSTVQSLLSLGWSEAAIHDVVQIVGYFNYVNRLAEGLGVELEPRWDA